MISGFFPVFSQAAGFLAQADFQDFKLLEIFFKEISKRFPIFLPKIFASVPSRIFDFPVDLQDSSATEFSGKKTLRLYSDGLAQDFHLIPF